MPILRALVLAILLRTLVVSASAADTPTLRVATYRSFTGEYGPGDIIKAKFESRCSCRVEWVLSDDAGSLYADLLGQKSKDIDVVAGFDQSMIGLFRSSNLLSPQRSEAKKDARAVLKQAEHYGTDYQPLDFGYYAVVIDTTKVKAEPKSLRDFLADPQFARSLAAQDPRTSTPGLGLLVWLKAVAEDQKDFESLLGGLGRQALTFAKGWTEAYGLFTKGETRSVFSYVTSELYHTMEEKTDRYRALPFAEGHPDQVEYAALVKASKRAELAGSFLSFLLETEIQKTIALRNWMFPVTQEALAAMPEGYRNHLSRFKPLQVDASLYETASRKQLTSTWSRVLAQSRQRR